MQVDRTLVVVLIGCEVEVDGVGTFFAAEEEGGVGGASWNWMRAPMEVANARNVIRLKYPFMPVSLCAMKPPTMKLVAIPIWFALIATEVARV